MIRTDIQRHCTECGQRLAGRSDKKFCNDQCRTAWHNKQHVVYRHAKKEDPAFWIMSVTAPKDERAIYSLVPVVL